MPKRIFLIAIAALAALAACNNINVNDLYGTATPSAGPTATVAPNPSATAAIVTVYASNSPQPGEQVSISNSSASARPIGTPFATQTTDSTGTTTFNNLTGSAWYCFAATYPQPGGSPLPAPTPLSQTQTQCTDLWGYGVTISF